MNKPFLVVGGILIIGVLGFIVLVAGDRDQSTSIPTQGTESNSTPGSQSSKFGKSPDFNLEDYDGDTVSLRDFKGKNIIVNSWAVWCPFCVKELGDFVKLQQELGEKITIIAIDRDESLEKTKGYTDDLGITDDLVFLLDPGDTFYRSLGGFTMPETIFVDGEGNILFHKRGPMTLEDMKSRVEELF